jgi:hypothetical protein
VECTGADDHSEPVGTALLRATELGIGFRVVLTQAAPSWTYYVELSQDGDCSAPKKFFGLKTDIDGKGVLEGIYAADAGPHAILVDVVSPAAHRRRAAVRAAAGSPAAQSRKPCRSGAGLSG